METTLISIIGKWGMAKEKEKAKERGRERGRERDREGEKGRKKREIAKYLR